MSKYLIVANQTLGGLALIDAVRERLAPDTTFHVVVPATPSAYLRWAQHSEASGGEIVPDAHGHRYAQRRLERELERLRSLGAQVDGEVGSVHPMEAVTDVLEREPFDEIIVSTLPTGLSRWLKMDLTDRIARHFDGPVTHVVGPAGDEDTLLDAIERRLVDAPDVGWLRIQSVERRDLHELVLTTDGNERYSVKVEALGPTD
jgi:nucleotide-binding universal stress UspA family protein